VHGKGTGSLRGLKAATAALVTLACALHHKVLLRAGVLRAANPGVAASA
jgi:hypothetical protein